MSLLHIAWRNFCHRPLSSILTTLSLSLGVALVVLVLSIYGIVNEAFTRNASLGYNLVVGPKGSPLQLTLNSVFYLSQPIENLPYTEYMEFFSKAERAEMLAQFGGDPALGERDGKYCKFVEGGYVIPLALGDYYGEFRVVGTIPDFFEKLRIGENLDEKFRFAEGRAFESFNQENGYFEAVLGSRVAREMGVSAGELLYPTHGDPEGKGHKDAFRIVGILQPTGTPNDRAAFVNLEGFYLMDNHSKPLDPDAPFQAATSASHEHIGDHEHTQPLSIPAREVTSILVRNGDILLAARMPNVINEGVQSQAVAPVKEISTMMNQFIGPVSNAMLYITLLTCFVAAAGVVVAIYNSMNDRRRDIAVMRALGARRDTVTAIIVFESLLVAVIGGAFGWLLAHIALAAYGGQIEEQTGIRVGFFSTSESEIWILPVVVSLAIFAALLPAFAAYRTDVGSNLSS